MRAKTNIDGRLRIEERKGRGRGGEGISLVEGIGTALGSGVGKGI